MTRLNKTLEIRRTASKMTATGHRPRPLEVVAALKKQGIHVVGSQVSMALKGTGMEYRFQTSPPDLKAAMKKVGLDDLEAAREYVRKVGDPEKASIALAVLKQLGN
jgi:hypothetical protein